MTRRRFLQSTAVLATASSLRFSPRAWSQPTGANEAVRFAVIGLGLKGTAHVQQLLKTPGVRVAALCDVDPEALARETEKLRAARGPVFASTDARAVLDRGDVDAVLIATCNHWHALLTIWACQAGKDVYVEKPVSHSIWEGRRMIEAAARHGRIVQAGTQLRSDTGLAAAVAAIRQGRLGRVRWIHGLCYTRRESIGRCAAWYPNNLDYDRWCGPAAMLPLERRALHYDWHWLWHTGNGDMANIGAHVMDIARRFLPADTPPRRVLSLGGRFGVEDAGETPNTQLALYDWPDTPVLFETRGLPTKPGAAAMDQLLGIRTGVVVHCEGGYYAGYIGGGLYAHDGRLIERLPGDGGAGHLANFVAAVRHRRREELAADLELGHASTSLCHFANLSYRLGEAAPAAALREIVEAYPPARDALAAMLSHLVAHGIEPERTRLRAGKWLPPSEQAAELALALGGEPTALARVETLLRGSHRPPYLVPDQI
jgi:predicted dehydrogenase